MTVEQVRDIIGQDDSTLMQRLYAIHLRSGAKVYPRSYKEIVFDDSKKLVHCHHRVSLLQNDDKNVILSFSYDDIEAISVYI